MAWKITLPSGTTIVQSEVTAAQYITVSEVLDGASWGALEPTVGPRQLVAWLAVLEAQESEEKNPMATLLDIMQRPMMNVLTCLAITE